ncbi:anti-sigma factor RsiW [Thermocatellispora tengchongensis]|uniref:Anti-sigma factor RsiW n=1 Tax=Thermocatellispora tengchongensis TaxID=1073253 RepID=A0A840P3I6_9ACTN|nr:zf-HC2 domain-containing protein [Thermocatellispora tengchongensis]MBB5133932.1 anti-sigma factor RsiW [Thermocatellispora tengchongensis]
MSHLGERVSALVDGELSHGERERALAHLTFCADCRAEVESMRALKSRLRSLDGPAMPADLTMSLLRMAEPGGPLPPRVRPFPDAQRTFGGVPIPAMHGIAPPDNRPRGRAKSRGGRARKAGYVAVGMASAAVAFGTMFVVGGLPTTPAVVPQMEKFANQHKTTVPYGGAGWIQKDHGPSAPTPTPTPTPTSSPFGTSGPAQRTR